MTRRSLFRLFAGAAVAPKLPAPQRPMRLPAMSSPPWASVGGAMLTYGDTFTVKWGEMAGVYRIGAAQREIKVRVR